MSEKCERCGSLGEDRRTLWMACFYQMKELNIPFTEVQIHGQLCQKTGERELPTIHTSIPIYEEPTGENHNYSFYKLRVCKRCRAEWLQAIRNWYFTTPNGIDSDADTPQETGIHSGIFIRENGLTKEISWEEWNIRNPNQEPIIVQKEEGT
ncbi:MAG: hypothetical protein KGL39_00830 [Patescibacteria group bacterium]|nr:hypothetical protein [Patescibacteria group bacterium]